MEASGQDNAPAALPPETGWAADPDWKIRRREKYLAPANIRTPDPTAQRLVTTPTAHVQV
jgi:hypothetical protein